MCANKARTHLARPCSSFCSAAPAGTERQPAPLHLTAFALKPINPLLRACARLQNTMSRPCPVHVTSQTFASRRSKYVAVLQCILIVNLHGKIIILSSLGLVAVQLKRRDTKINQDLLHYERFNAIIRLLHVKHGVLTHSGNAQ